RVIRFIRSDRIERSPLSRHDGAVSKFLLCAAYRRIAGDGVRYGGLRCDADASSAEPVLCRGRANSVSDERASHAVLRPANCNEGSTSRMQVPANFPGLIVAEITDLG